MSDPIIKVEGVSKKFIISHEAPERYKSLRDVMAEKVKGMVRNGKKKLPESREEFYALKDINFEVHPGDRLGIIGRNGAGKSTLLKILSRITEPSTGRITIRGRVASLLEVGTGFHPELTGRENVFLNGAILGMGRAEIRKKFDEIVAFAEVEKFLDTPVKRYSSGMYVRLAFAVAAYLEPEILIVDEVLAVGDAQFQKKCLGKMEDVSKNEGRTVLFVSHNMGVIAQLCQKAILLKNGVLMCMSNTQDVIQTYMTNEKGTESEYVADETVSLIKQNYFTRISSYNERNELIDNFAFNESITLRFNFVINQKLPNVQIGVGLNDKYQNRIFTVLKPISFFQQKNDGEYKGVLVLPANIIAPNHYSFAFAIWTKDGRVFDLQENVCPIKIHDSGTELALYEGVDHGSIIINPIWNIDY